MFEKKGRMEIKKETVTLRRIRRFLLQRLSSDLAVDVGQENFLGNYLIRVIEEQLAIKAGQRLVEYPENWIEAIKDRWLPGWLKKRWPVKFKTYDALVIFPELLAKHPVHEILRKENYYFTFAESGEIIPED